MKTLLIAAILAIAADDAEAQDRYRYEQYGTELRRIPGYGTLDAPMYRGESERVKRRSPLWPRLFDRNYRREYPTDNRYRRNPY